jgi:large subunit ribosomal protein L7/L12
MADLAKIVDDLSSLTVIEAAPKPVKEAVSKADAEKIKAQLEAAGAKVELK